MAAETDIFLLMAGLGVRFKQQGYTVPKPLIEFEGAPLFIWALRSLKELLPQSRLHLVVCAEDKIEDQVRRVLAAERELKYLNVEVITLAKRTAGPLESATQALQNCSSAPGDNPILFCDCDFYLESKDWSDAVLNWHGQYLQEDAFLVTFFAEATKHSFVKTDGRDHAIEVAEKKVISNKAVAGFYSFKSAKLFKEFAGRVFTGPSAVENEHFISQVYVELIQAGKKVKVFNADKMILLGTPEEIQSANISK